MFNDDAGDDSDYFICHNQIYSAEALIDSTRAVVERYDYDAYGTPVIYTADGGDGNWWDGDETTATVSAKGLPYLFTGREFDLLDQSGGDLALQYSRARYYSFDLRRWLQRDPIEYADGMNLYEYAESSATTLLDPFGLLVKCQIFLTFDDGPDHGTNDVIDVLDEVGLQGKVTFFIIGAHLTRSFRYRAPWRGRRKWTGTQLVQLEYRLKNLIANHSFVHARNQYAKWYRGSPENTRKDFDKNRRALARIIGEVSKKPPPKPYPGLLIARLPGRNTWRVGKINVTDKANK